MIEHIVICILFFLCLVFIYLMELNKEDAIWWKKEYSKLDMELDIWGDRTTDLIVALDTHFAVGIEKPSIQRRTETKRHLMAKATALGNLLDHGRKTDAI